MGPLDALWHLLNFGIPAMGVGLMTATLAKLLWRGELAGVRWQRLAAFATGAAALALVAGLVAFGRDGMMITYGLVVLLCAAVLWWAGFGPGRR